MAPGEISGRPSPHWASSSTPSVGGWRNKGPIDGYSTTKTAPRARDANRMPSWEAVAARGSSTPPGLRFRGGGGGGKESRDRAGGGRLVANVAEASRLLDGLLEEQQELEAFLEEEFAIREREQGREFNLRHRVS